MFELYDMDIETDISETQFPDNEGSEIMNSEIFSEYGIESYSDNPMGTEASSELKNFNPIEGNDIYNSGESMEHWEYQGNTERCAQFSQLFVIEEFTGVELDPDSFCRYSEMNGWFDESRGTAPENINKMLDAFGIKNELSEGNSINDLLECLENDGRALVALDSGEYWNGEGEWEDIFDPNGADHVVEVIGYNPETESVILNDSGSAEGCGEEVPVETFVDAWNDSNNLMVKCYR